VPKVRGKGERRLDDALAAVVVRGDSISIASLLRQLAPYEVSPRIERAAVLLLGQHGWDDQP